MLPRSSATGNIHHDLESFEHFSDVFAPNLLNKEVVQEILQGEIHYETENF